jgi:hypothetical protein
VENHGRPQKSVTGVLSQEQYDGKSEDFKQHTVKLVDKSTFQGDEEPVENTLLEAPTTIVTQFSNVLMPPMDVAVARIYDHLKARELHDSSPVALNRLGRVSASPGLKVSATLLAAVEDNHRCDRFQQSNDMTPEAGSSKSGPRSPKAASWTGQYIETSASSQRLRMNNEKHPMYAPVPDDTKELESSLVQTATACVPQNRNDNASVQAAYGARINNHSRAEGSEKVTGGHAMNWSGQERSFPRPGTKISTLLSPVLPTPSNDNKDNESTALTGKDSTQVSPRTLAHIEVSNMRDSGVSNALLGKLASAREKL